MLSRKINKLMRPDEDDKSPLPYSLGRYIKPEDVVETPTATIRKIFRVQKDSKAESKILSYITFTEVPSDDETSNESISGP